MFQGSGELSLNMMKNYATDSRHLVLLKGYQLQGGLILNMMCGCKEGVVVEILVGNRPEYNLVNLGQPSVCWPHTIFFVLWPCCGVLLTHL